MRTKTYIRIFLLILVTSASLILFSYSRKKTTETTQDQSTECGGKSCGEKKAQSEFILWESLTRNLLTSKG